jgi:hypothetical protein
MYPIDASTICEIQRQRQAWTSEKPTVAGYYWLRLWKEALFDVEMVLTSDDCTTFTPWGSDYDYKVSEVDGQWSGPLEPPSC